MSRPLSFALLGSEAAKSGFGYDFVMNDITRILSAIEQGDSTAAEQLLPRVYEEQWQTCDEPASLLDFLREKVSDQVVRRYACACARRAWHLMTDERSRLAVELSERLTDGRATVQERGECWLQANNAALSARRRVAFPEEASTLAFAAAAEAAELVLYPSGDWALLQCSLKASATALAYEAAAAMELPLAEPWANTFTDEDAEAIAWTARYEEFQRTVFFDDPYRRERAIQADLLRELVGNPFLMR